MASGFSFGQLQSAAGRTSVKNLVEFRAGKMKLNGKTVTADKRKGLVYIYQSDDSLMHFCWKDRTSGNVEDVSMKYVCIVESVSLLRHFFRNKETPFY